MPMPIRSSSTLFHFRRAPQNFYPGIFLLTGWLERIFCDRWNGRRVWRHLLLGRCCASRAFHSHFRISFRKGVKLSLQLQLFLNSCQKEFMHPSKIDFFSVLSGSATKKRRLENKIVSNLSRPQYKILNSCQKNLCIRVK